MEHSLYYYQVPQQVSGVLKSWLKDACVAALRAPKPSAILGTGGGAISFLKELIIDAQLHHLGILSYLHNSFLKDLLESHRLSFQLVSLPDLTLVLESLSESSSDPAIKTLSQNATALARKILELDSARHPLSVLEDPSLESLAEKARKALADNQLYFPQAFYQKVLEKVAKAPPFLEELFVYGFQDKHPQTVPLLKLGFQCARKVTLCLPQNEGDWPEELAKQFPKAIELKGGAKLAGPFLELADSLKLGGELHTATPPINLYRFPHAEAEANLIVKLAARAASEPKRRVGIISPDRGKMGAELTRQLEGLGIPWHDRLGRTSTPNKAEEMLEHYILFQKQATVTSLLSFASRLRYYEHPDSVALPALQSALKQKISKSGTLCLSTLLNTVEQLRTFRQAFPLLPSRQSFKLFLREFERLLPRLGFPPSLLNDTFSTWRQADFPVQSLSALNWLESQNFLKRFQRSSAGGAVFAPLSVLTAKDALQQAFTHLFIVALSKESMGTEEGERFISGSKSQFLNDFITHSHTAEVGQRHARTLACLVASVSEQVSLSYHARETQAGILRPHFFLTQASHLVQKPVLSLRAQRSPSAKLEAAEEVRHAWEQRRRGTYNPWLYFDLDASLEKLQLSIKDCGEAFLRPSQAWCQHVLRADLPESFAAESLLPLIRGSHMHRCLELPEKQQRPPSVEEWVAQVKKNAEKMAPPELSVAWLWAHQAMVGDLIKAVEQLGQLRASYQEVSSEQAIEVVVENSGHPLAGYKLSGKMDLLYTCGDKALVVDLKTGQGKLDLRKGEGVQIFLYAFALKCQGFKEVKLALLKPQEPLKLIDFDEAAFLPLAKRLQGMLEGQLGQSPLEISNYGGGASRQPIATVPLEKRELEKAWRQHYQFP